ncbi:LuxR C-terminal-related transcriptional regulator [Cryobacterium arcticum]|uniref:LuxR family transcriptional regulator n=1 Tax=Cryobacterium arcticum TaxID=670052 RepID=A0A1B1BER6_9MICO|nr:LuxR C-terminal-related transcriptional regulator [Cryobacterium arcticum]ANP71070.1 LuxR family transcriptional regulator [Cryobacterium arcticum]
MKALGTSRSIELLGSLQTVVASPLPEIAGHFSELLRPLLGHSALVIFTEDCTGRPQKKAGDKAIIDEVTLPELDAVRRALAADDSDPWGRRAVIGGSDRPITAWTASTGALLVLTDPELTAAGAADPESTLAMIDRLWQLVATSIRQQVAAAAPAYLQDSRAASAERAKLIADLTDAHSTTLESLLAVLRAPSVSAEAARQTAIELAASAMVSLRAVSDRDRSLAEEPVAQAFARLRDDLRPLVRFGDLDVQFIEPPANGRALPGEVAHAGRAIVRGAVLALVEQSGVSRVRVQWDCDGSNLLIQIRDDGAGALTADSPGVSPLTGRVAALGGSFDVQATAGWGSELTVSLPLDAPLAPLSPAAEWGLSPREQGVLALVASGARNKAIAAELVISENTVKFHVANLLRKVGASTRSELAALAR